MTVQQALIRAVSIILPLILASIVSTSAVSSNAQVRSSTVTVTRAMDTARIEECDSRLSSLIDCKNGGECRLRRNNNSNPMKWDQNTPYFLQYSEKELMEMMYCECPRGYKGLYCEVEVSFCGGNDDDKNYGLVCYNGSECKTKFVDDAKEILYCDCSAAFTHDQSFAGEKCEHGSTTFCTKKDSLGLKHHSFCTNNGICVELVDETQEHKGCDCLDGWDGAHCEQGRMQSESNSTTTLPQPPRSGSAVGKAIMYALLLVVLSSVVVSIFQLWRSMRQEQRNALAGNPVSGLESILDADGSSLTTPTSEIEAVRIVKESVSSHNVV